MIKVIIFDMDDTLYKEYDFVFGGFKVVANYIEKKYLINSKKIYDEIINIFNKEGRGQILNKICDKYNIDEDIKNLVDIYRYHNPNIELYDDAEEILKWCKENNIKTGLITDGMSKVQWNKIKALKLDKKIDKIIVSDDFGKEYWKPHIRTYKEIMEYFNVKGENAIYVGDNPKKDFIGAKTMKINTVRICRDTGDYSNITVEQALEAEKIIHSLREIKNYLL